MSNGEKESNETTNEELLLASYGSRRCMVGSNLRHLPTTVDAPRAPMTVHLSGHPNERVTMDIIGPLKTSASGNEYVLCMTDHFSRYARAIAMPDQRAY